jgi:peroxiredoxin
VPKRSAFAIDKNGVICFVDIKDHPKDLPDFDALKSALSKLS